MMNLNLKRVIKINSSKILLTTLVQWKKTGPTIEKNLDSIVKNVMFNPVSREKLVQKLEKHTRPENLNSLKIKKCNSENWSEMLQSRTISKDLKAQKMQGCILKAVGTISKVTDALLELKYSKI